MKKLIVLSLATVAIMAQLSSCKKTDYNNSSTIIPAGSNNIATLFAALRPASQSFTVTAGTYQTITTTSGSKVSFYPNTFKDASGHIITSGTVNIQLTEAAKPGDMILNRAFPVSTDGQLLISGGEMNLKATMGGQPVYANKYGVQFRQPTGSSQPMNLFIGSTGSDSSTTWTLGDTTTGTTATGTTIDSTAVTNAYYTFDSCNHFNWINCDHFLGSGGTLTDVNVVFPDTSYNRTNTAAFIVFPSINSVMNVYDDGTSGGFTARNVPVGMTVKVVTLSYKSGNAYYAEQTGVVVTSGIIIHPTPAVQTLTYITSALSAL